MPGIHPLPVSTNKHATIDDLVRRHQAGLWRYLRALGADAALAEELVQDAFVVAFERGLQDRGHAATSQFLRRTARHVMLRARRDAGRDRARLLELADARWQSECAADDGDAWLEALRSCLGKLDSRRRQAIGLWYGADRDRANAAARLDLEPNGLKMLLQRVRHRLRLCIEGQLHKETNA